MSEINILIRERKKIIDQIKKTSRAGHEQEHDELQKTLSMMNDKILYVHREENKIDDEPKQRKKRP